MDHSACFLKPFGSERVNESQKLLKSAEKCFYPTFSSLWTKLTEEKLFLIRSQISGLLVNPLTGNYEYSRSNRENLPLPIQIKLSRKPIIFYEFFFFFFYCIFEMYIKFPMFWRKHAGHTSSISEVLDSERCVYLNG